MPGATLSPEKPLRLLREQLDSLGLADVVQVEVDIVPRLEIDPLTKKFQRIISRVGPPDDLEQSFRDRAPVPAGQALLARRRDQP